MTASPTRCMLCGIGRRDGTSLFSWPNDPHKSEEWLTMFNIHPRWLALFAKPKMCSRHFKPSDFTFRGPHLRLNSDAVPTFDRSQIVVGWAPIFTDSESAVDSASSSSSTSNELDFLPVDIGNTDTKRAISEEVVLVSAASNTNGTEYKKQQNIMQMHKYVRCQQCGGYATNEVRISGNGSAPSVVRWSCKNGRCLATGSEVLQMWEAEKVQEAKSKLRKRKMEESPEMEKCAPPQDPDDVQWL